MMELLQGYQSTQRVLLNKFRLFYQPPNDTHFYHVTVTCKIIFQNYPQNSESLEDGYDYEFSYQSYHVACKLLPHPLIVNMLNREIYKRDFDVNDLKRKNRLNWNQKLNLEVNLKRDLPFLQDQILNRFVTYYKILLQKKKKNFVLYY